MTGRTFLFGTVLALAVDLAACGSRSGLEVQATGGSAVGGAGGETGGTGPVGGAGGAGATGAAGGTGGAPPGCTELALVGTPVAVPSLPGASATAPRIHLLPDGRAGIVHTSEPPSDSSLAMVITVASWLTVWPPEFEAPVLLDPTRGGSFTVDRGPSSYLAVLAGTLDTPPGLSYGLVDPALPPFSPSVDTSPTATRALSLRTTSYRFLVGMEEPGPFVGGPSFHLLAGWVHQPPNGIQYEGPIVMGCTDRPGRIDGMETSEGRLLVTPVPLGGCADDVGPSPPSALTVTRLGNDNQWYFGLSLQMPRPITDLVVVPGTPGGLIAYGLDGGDMEPPRLEVVEIDAQGLLVKGPVPLSPPGSAAFGFDADGFLNGRVVAAFEDDPANNAADLTVVLASADGIITVAQAKDASPGGKPAVVTWPEQGSILVAFEAPGENAQTVIHVARFDCVGN